MYRVVALGLLFLAATACGGGGAADDNVTPTQPPATPTTVQTVAGARTEAATPSATTGPDGSYTVVEGDTLSEIAARFDTTVDALVAANNLTDANALSVGQVLIVSVTATATPAATATQ